MKTFIITLVRYSTLINDRTLSPMIDRLFPRGSDPNVGSMINDPCPSRIRHKRNEAVLSTQ